MTQPASPTARLPRPATESAPAVRLQLGVVSLLAAAAMLVPGMNAYSMWPDEINMAVAALSFDPLNPSTYNFREGHPPLYFVLAKGWTVAVGQSDFSLRLFSLAAALLAAAFVYRIAADFAPQIWGGLAAALVFAAMGFVRYHVHQTHNYALLLLGSMALLFFYARWWARPQQIVYAVGIVLSTAALIYTHYYSLYFIGALNLHALFRIRRRGRDWLRWMGWQALALVLYLPWVGRIYVITRRLAAAAATNPQHLISIPTGQATSWSTVAKTITVMLSNQVGFYAFFLVSGLAFLLARFRSDRERWRATLARLGWLALLIGASLALALTVNLVAQTFLARRVIYVLPLFAIAIGSLLTAMPRRLGLSGLALVAGFTFVAGWAPNLKGDWGARQAVEAVAEAWQPNDLLLIQFDDGFFYEWPLSYYAKHLLPPEASVLTLGNQSLSTVVEQTFFARHIMADRVWARNRLWVIRSTDSAIAPTSTDWVQLIDGREYVERYSTQLGWLVVSRFEAAQAQSEAPPGAVAPPTKAVLPQSFGGLFELTDYHIERLSVHPGDSLAVWLDWRALRLPDEDYAVFVHLLADDGKTLIGQIDEDPFHLERPLPTTFWPVGAPIFDAHRLTIAPDAPAGHYQLRLGIYSRLRPVRLAPLPGNGDGANSLLLATIDVNP
jgi:hypothetical protein